MSKDAFKRILFHWDNGIALITIVILFILFILWKTTYPGNPPIHSESGYAVAYRNVESTTVAYDRYFTVDTNFTGQVHRTVECLNQRTYDVPSITRSFTKGRHHTKRTFSIEYTFSINKGCVMRTWVEYKPLGSLRSHLYELNPIEFTVLPGKANNEFN